MCPGRQPIKIGSSNQQPVSIHIYFNNFVQRTKPSSPPHHQKHQQQQNQESHAENDRNDIYLRIVEKEIHGRYNNNHHDNNSINNGYNNRINATHNNNNLNAEKVAENNRNVEWHSNNSIKNNNESDMIEENVGNVKHFINIYHWIVHSTAADEFVASEQQKGKQN